MNFESITNNITSYLQDIANTNNLVIRYDNDPRETPTSGFWCKCNIDFDDSEQKEIGINSYRTVGNLIIELYHAMGIGDAPILRQVDILVAQFTELIVNNLVKFKTPIIRIIGRVDDNYQVNVICPFYVDN